MSGTATRFTPFESSIIDMEGFKSNSYRDTRGNATIGFGFKEGPAKGMKNISQEQALKLFREYYMPTARQAAVKFVGTDVYSSLTGAQRLALVDMAYNMGEKGLSKFVDTRKAILNKDWVRAGAEILNSDYAKQLPGRARRNAKRMVTGVEE